MKQILMFLFLSLTLSFTGYSAENELKDISSVSSNFEAFNSFDPFGKKNRDFTIIDRETGESNYHTINFKSIWLNADYSVYIWRHPYPSEVYEIKSYYASDVSNFMAVIGTADYGSYDVKYRKDGRKHVKFRCDDFAKKLKRDIDHMLEIK